MFKTFQLFEYFSLFPIIVEASHSSDVMALLTPQRIGFVYDKIQRQPLISIMKAYKPDNDIVTLPLFSHFFFYVGHLSAMKGLNIQTISSCLRETTFYCNIICNLESFNLWPENAILMKNERLLFFMVAF